MTRTISATIHRDGEFWLVYVPEVDQHTQARTLADVGEMACDLAGLVLDEAVADIMLGQVDIVDLPEE